MFNQDKSLEFGSTRQLCVTVPPEVVPSRLYPRWLADLSCRLEPTRTSNLVLIFNTILILIMLIKCNYNRNLAIKIQFGDNFRSEFFLFPSQLPRTRTERSTNRRRVTSRLSTATCGALGGMITPRSRRIATCRSRSRSTWSTRASSP